MSKTREELAGDTEAVFDIDDTAVDASTAMVLNTPIFDALIEKGITRIRFLTSMNQSTLTNDLDNLRQGKDNYTREKLIAALTNYKSERFPNFKGFKITGVMTLNDLAYNESDRPIGKYYATVWQKAYKELENKIKKNKIPEHEITNEIRKYKVDKVSDEKQDNDIKAAIEAIATSRNLSTVQIKNLEKERTNNPDIQKWINENRNETKGKVFALMLDQRKHDKKNAPNSFIFFDDLAHELGAVAAANKTSASPVALTCIEVRGRQGSGYKGDFSLLKEKDPVKLVKNKEELKARYSSQIESHFTRLDHEQQFSQSHVADFSKKEFTEAWNKALGGEKTTDISIPEITTESSTPAKVTIPPARPTTVTPQLPPKELDTATPTRQRSTKAPDSSIAEKAAAASSAPPRPRSQLPPDPAKADVVSEWIKAKESAKASAAPEKTDSPIRPATVPVRLQRKEHGKDLAKRANEVGVFSGKHDANVKSNKASGEENKTPPPTSPGKGSSSGSG